MSYQSQQYIDLTRDELITAALDHHEGKLANNGAFSTETGKRTGRSPKDRYIVKDHLTQNTVEWGAVNQAMSAVCFETLWQNASKQLKTKSQFVSHLAVGADPKHQLRLKLTTATAWHSLFANNMFIRDAYDTSQWCKNNDWELLHDDSLTLIPNETINGDTINGDGVVAICFSQRRVLFCGMRYAGEIKKSMFSVLNFLLTDRDVLPMHCAANVGESGDVSLFFGLSGTGKTTLSADTERFLIGDDEHGWSSHGVFNFEGGCYAKCIDLSQEKEPLIWQAIRHEAILENVVLDETGNPDYKDDRLTQNSRCSYPLTHIKKRVAENRAGHPNAVIFLTCDLYGVLPPVAILSPEQAAYHFLSGYTALVGSTEMGGNSGVKPTFSTCFGAPFFARPPAVYANLLMKRLQETGAQVYLVNTGWTGGAYGQGGTRFDIPVTRTVIHAIQSGQLLNTTTQTILNGFDLVVPTKLDGVDSQLLNPTSIWKNNEDFNTALTTLRNQFADNFKRFDVDDSIKQAGPHHG